MLSMHVDSRVNVRGHRNGAKLISRHSVLMGRQTNVVDVGGRDGYDE